jgi:hypothetical protein
VWSVNVCSMSQKFLNFCYLLLVHEVYVYLLEVYIPIYSKYVYLLEVCVYLLETWAELLEVYAYRRQFWDPTLFFLVYILS